MCIHVCVAIYMCVHVCVTIWKLEIDIGAFLSPPSFLRHGILLNLELTYWLDALANEFWGPVFSASPELGWQTYIRPSATLLHGCWRSKCRSSCLDGIIILIFFQIFVSIKQTHIQRKGKMQALGPQSLWRPPCSPEFWCLPRPMEPTLYCFSFSFNQRLKF